MDEYRLQKGQRRQNLKNKKENFSTKKRRNSSSRELVAVYEDTIKIFSCTKVTVPDSELINVEQFNIIEDRDKYSSENLVVITENKDTLDMALEFSKHKVGENANKKLNILVLNMASEYKSGGGVRSGKTAQEECLFRRTNAHFTHPEEWYPLDEKSVIFSPKVIVIKDSEYKMLKKKDIFKIGMMTVPGIRKPRLDYDGEYCDEDRHIMAEKIDSIFKVGIKHKYDALVLGALGCGVFKNPPDQVAALFRDSIRRYGRHFKKIGFAVLTTKKGEEGNFDRFKKLATEK